MLKNKRLIPAEGLQRQWLKRTRQELTLVSRVYSQVKLVDEFHFLAIRSNALQHWVPVSRRRRQDEGHPLLGVRHESPRGETMYETDIYASDPAWMVDHLVYEQVVAPGGLYGAMAVSAAFADGAGPAFVEEMQMYSALMFEEETDSTGRKLQLILDASDGNSSRRFEIFSKGESEEGWLRHAEGRIRAGKNHSSSLQHVDLNAIKADLTRQSTADFYEMRSADKIYLGPFYHTMKAVWAREGEAVGELVLQESVDATGMENASLTP